MRAAHGQIVFDLVLLALAAAALVGAHGLPQGGAQVSSGLFPLMVLWAGAGLMVVILFKDVASLQRSRATGKSNPQHMTNRRSAVCLVLVAAELLIYVLTFEGAGFLVSTALFLFAGVLTCEILLNFAHWPDGARLRRMIMVAAAIGVGVSALCYLLFTQVFKLGLP